MTEAPNAAIEPEESLTLAGRLISDVELQQCGGLSIGALQLPSRAAAIAGRLGVLTVGELARVPLIQLLQLPGCSANAIHDLRSRVVRTLDSCVQRVQWKDSILDRPLACREMRVLLDTAPTELRLSANPRAAVIALKAASALDVALAPRSCSVLRGGRSSADKIIRELDVAIWRVLEYQERQTKRELRLTVARLRRHMPIVFGAPQDTTVFGRPLSADEEALCRATALDVLGLSVRATNVLKDTDFATAFDIATANRERVLDVKNCGRTTVREFQLAVAQLVAGETSLDAAIDRCVSGSYLDQDPSSAAQGTVFGRPLTAQEEAICWATPADVLGLSVRAMRVVKACSFGNALEIATASRHQLLELKNCGRTTLRELRAAVAQAIESPADSSTAADPIPLDRLKDEIISMLSTLDSRSRFVLEGRFGLWDGQRKTLEQLAGGLGGVTRERVRQIETKACNKLRGSLIRRRAVALLRDIRDSLFDPQCCPSFAGLLTAGDVEVLLETGIDDPVSGARAAALRFLVGVFDDDLKRFKEGLCVEHEGEVWFRSKPEAARFKRLESETRTLLASKGKPLSVGAAFDALARTGINTTEVELSRLARVSREIGMSAGELALRSWNRFRRGRAAARIERALGELGQPTHYSYIVERLNFLFPDKAPFVGHAITATMLRYPDVFVSLGRGVYALRNWGVSRPPYVKDFVIETMRAEGGQATVEHVAALGAKKYGFKSNSIAMTMSLHPTFFQRVRGTLYRLR